MTKKPLTTPFLQRMNKRSKRISQVALSLITSIPATCYISQLLHRTDGTDAFDTHYIGCAKFPQQTTSTIAFSGVS